MAPTTLDWKGPTAECSFVLANRLCLSEGSHWVDLPSFAAPDDDDLTWTLSFRPGDWLGSAYEAKWTCFRLRFRSASGKQRVFAHPRVVVSQRASPTTIDKTIKSLARARVILSENNFRIDTKKAFTDAFQTIDLGYIVICNELTNEVHIRACVKTSDKVWDVKNPPTLPRKRLNLEEDCAGETSLSACLGSLLEDPVFSDVTLVVDGREFPAHRSILAARSCVFKAMMNTSCKETLTGKVVIEDLRPAIVERMLRYMYRGTPWNVRDEASSAEPAEQGSDADGDGSGDGDEDGTLLELMVAADKYMLPGLVALCQQRLAASLTDNPSEVKLCDVLRASHLLECAPLRRVGLEYLRCNRLKVLRSDAWKEFASSYRMLASGALLDALTDASEDTSS